jgi:hypothetical protein
MIKQFIKSVLFALCLACIIAYDMPMPLLALFILIALWIGEWYFEDRN